MQIIIRMSISRNGQRSKMKSSKTHSIHDELGSYRADHGAAGVGASMV
jgi:hypothetical protein